MIKSYLSSFIILLVVLLIETAVLSNIIVLPAIPDLVLLCTLYFSLQNGKIAGEVDGFVGGLMIDFLSGGPFGLNCLIRCIIGYIGGLFSRIMNISGILVPCLLGLIATVIKAILPFGVSIFFPNYVNTYNIFSLAFISELIMNTVLAPIVFWLLNHFASFILLDKRIVNKWKITIFLIP